MTAPTARTQSARRLLHRFLNWWAQAPFYIALWFIPLVMMVFVIAVVKNFLTGDK